MNLKINSICIYFKKGQISKEKSELSIWLHTIESIFSALLHMRLRRCGAFSKSLSWFDHRLVNKHKVFKKAPQRGKHKHNCVNAHTFYLHIKAFFSFKCLISQGMSLVCL